MNINSQIDFPPLESCLKTPHLVSAANSPSMVDSPLNPDAEAFTPRSPMVFNDTFGCSYLEYIPSITVEMDSLDTCIGSPCAGPAGDTPLKNSQELSNSKLLWRKTPTPTRKRYSGKRRLSMTSFANTSMSSVDANVQDTLENENDPDVLSRREKNIMYGKNTDAYGRYISILPKANRINSSPRTPLKEMKYSRRQWDGLVKHWKIRLHDWDRNVTGGSADNPTNSTPKRSKTKCDRRSYGNSTPNRQTVVDMLPPSIKMMFSDDSDSKNNTEEIEEQSTDFPQWNPQISTDRIVDWSKECETSEDEDCDEIPLPKSPDAKDDGCLNIEKEKMESKDIHAKSDLNEPCSSAESFQNSKDVQKDENDKSVGVVTEEDGTAYKCVSLVEAINAFDEGTYNEEEDEDYLPPEERGLKLEEIGLGESDGDSDSDTETLFYWKSVDGNVYGSH